MARQGSIWVTREGEELKVKDMELSHMYHCVHMVCRSRRVGLLMLSDALNAFRYAADAPDGAAMAAEGAADELMDAAYDPAQIGARLPYAIRISPALKAMVRRLKKAKYDYLTPPSKPGRRTTPIISPI